MAITYIDEEPVKKSKITYLDDKKDISNRPDQSAGNQNPENGVTSQLTPGRASFGDFAKAIGRSMVPHPLDAYKSTVEASAPLTGENTLLTKFAGLGGALGQIYQPIVGPAGIAGRLTTAGEANILGKLSGNPLSEQEKAQLDRYALEGKPTNLAPETQLPSTSSTALNTGIGLAQDAFNHPVELAAIAKVPGFADKIPVPDKVKNFSPNLVPGPLVDIKNAIFDSPKIGVEGQKVYENFNLPKETPKAAVQAAQRALGQYLNQGGKAQETASRWLNTVTDAGFTPSNNVDGIVGTKLTINKLGPKLREMAAAVGDDTTINLRDVARDTISDYRKKSNDFKGIPDSEKINKMLDAKVGELKGTEMTIDELFQNVSTRSQMLASKAKKLYGEFKGEDTIAKGDPDLYSDKLILDSLRNELINAVEKDPGGGPENSAYREMRKNYGALIRAYDAQVKKYTVTNRQNALGLYEGLGLLGAATHLAGGPGIPALMALGGKGIKLYNHPSAQVSKAFRLTQNAKRNLPKSAQAQALE